MKLNRRKNSIRNAFYGTIYKCVGILGPFAVRTAIIYTMGNEYVGLSSLFTSLLSYLSLAELGAGTALVFSMYKPIAEEDTEAINALYNLYRKVYRIIGVIIAALGIAIIPFLKFIVNKDVPDDINFYILYLIYILNTVLSYWLYAYKQSLLTAFQRTDIISKRSLAVQLMMYIVQILTLTLTHNYYLYILWLPVATVVTNIANKIIVDKMFPQFKCEGKVSKEVEQSIKKKIMALFGTKANSIVMHATDNIVISAFLGLKVVGRYGNYYYIMNSVALFVKIFYASITAGLGNSLQTESKEKNYSDFKMLTFLNSWVIMFCSTCLLCLYQPFMKIWVGKKSMYGLDIAILLVIYFYVYMMRRIVLTYKDAAGLWWEDRFRPYVVMFVNLGLNITLCQVIGLYGIILSTIISMIIAVPWENYTVFKYLFHEKSGSYYFTMAFCCLVSVGIMGGTWFICNKFMEGILGIAIRLIICVIVPNLVWVILFHNKKEYDRAKKMLLGKRG